MKGNIKSFGCRWILLAVLLTLMTCFACPVSAIAATVQGIRIVKLEEKLFEGDTVELEVTGSAAEGEKTWSSSNTKVATVDEHGVLTCLNKGWTTVTVRSTVEKRTWRGQLEIQVLKNAESIEVDERDLSILQEDAPSLEGILQERMDLPVLSLVRGQSLTVRATVLPQGASNRRYVLSSSDTTVLSVNGTTIRGAKKGECVLTVSSQLNPEVSVAYHVLVAERVREIKVTGPSRQLMAGGSLQLSAAVSPDNATIRDVVWKSQNEKVATVDEKGLVTGIARGQAIIRATAIDGSRVYGSFTVTVVQGAMSIELSQSYMNIAVGYNKSLRATVLPGNTNDKSVVWTSSDETVAKVNQWGSVTPVHAGTCQITCQAKDNPMVMATCEVVVTQPVRKISFMDQSVSVNTGASVRIYWQLEPSDVTNTDVRLSSTNEKIATVTEDGVVAGVKKGECYVVAKAEDGSGKTARVKIKVLQPVQGVHMKNDTVYVDVDETTTLQAIMEPEDASNRTMTWEIGDSSIATVRGKNNRPSVTGRRWGTTFVTGVTEDGGYSTQATIKVGNYDSALRITDLYIRDNRIRIVVQNQSDMDIDHFRFTMECWDVHGQPIAVTDDGSNLFQGAYYLPLSPQESTRHGQFAFTHYVQPEEQIGYVEMTITSYTTDTGFRRNIREDKQPVMDYQIPGYLGE